MVLTVYTFYIEVRYPQQLIIYSVYRRLCNLYGYPYGVRSRIHTYTYARVCVFIILRTGAIIYYTEYTLHVHCTQILLLLTRRAAAPEVYRRIGDDGQCYYALCIPIYINNYCYLFERRTRAYLHGCACTAAAKTVIFTSTRDDGPTPCIRTRTVQLNSRHDRVR